MKEKTDRIFLDSTKAPRGFLFDKRVAAVFDNMLHRSIPFYREIQRMVVECAIPFIQPDTAVYDLGCSIGTTLLALSKASLPVPVTLLGVDGSEAMLARCRETLASSSVPIPLVYHDLNIPFPFQRASFISMILSLQFLMKENRKPLLHDIFRALVPNGAFILVEKVKFRSPLVQSHFQKGYYDFKRRNGYSEEEIYRKEEALKHVLVPLSIEKNKKWLKEAGFSIIQTFFQWYNFVGFLAVKS